MDNYTTDELQEARRPIASLISKSEKVQQKLASGTWQHTMLQDNLKALQIASALLNKETTDTDNFTQDDLQEALRTFVSMISKTEKNHGTTLAHNDVSRVFNRCKSQRYSCVSSVSYPGRYAAFCRWWGDSAAQERWFADTSGTYESEVVSCQEYEETGIIIDHTTIHSKHNSQESTFRMMVTYVFRKEGDQWRLVTDICTAIA